MIIIKTIEITLSGSKTQSKLLFFIGAGRVLPELNALDSAASAMSSAFTSTLVTAVNMKSIRPRHRFFPQSSLHF